MTKFIMFFKAVACITCLLITSSVNAQVSWPPPSTNMQGSGVFGDPWQITTEYELEYLATYVNAGNGLLTVGVYYKLMSDLDYINYQFNSVLGWNPIGNNVVKNAIFKGNFNGNNNVIFNLPSHRFSEDYIGLFGYISNATIHNLGIDMCNIAGHYFVGGLVGRADNSIIKNCYALNTPVEGTSYTGGLVGSSYNSNISESYTLCEVNGESFCGGFMGRNFGVIQASYAKGNVTINDYEAGGFVGANNGTIVDCYATGNVTGNLLIGGFVGANKENSITYCYASGEVTGVSGIGNAGNIGGFAGDNADGNIRNCVAANNIVSGGIFNMNRIAGTNTGVTSNNYAFDDMDIPTTGSGEYGIGKNWATLTSFNFYNTNSNWFNNEWSIDIVTTPKKIWKICDDGTLPHLQWEGIECDTISCDFNAYGTGVQGNPYRIYKPCQLADLATYVNNGNGAQTANIYFKLMNDLDLIKYSAGDGWEPIGNYSTNNSNTVFQGNFDGKNKVISNLIINRPKEEYIGLFGRTFNANIHDIGIESSVIDGGQYIGSLIGYVSGTSTFENCYAIKYSTIVTYDLGTTYGTGGLIGFDYGNSTFTNCYAEGTLSGTAAGIGYVHGLAGLIGWCAGASNISNCHATASITGTTNGTGWVFGIGGLVGYSYATDIYNSYAISDINGEKGVGGLIGSNHLGTINGCYATGELYVSEDDAGGIAGLNGGTISNCYSTVNISGTGRVIGGLVGSLTYSTSNITYCYATGTISGFSYVGGLVGICSGIIRNCVAANDYIENTSWTPINRIVASVQNNGIISDNYAYENMVVTNNGYPITPMGNNAGIPEPMSTLISFDFYNENLGNIWYNNIPWDIDNVPNSSVIWGICDGETLPFFQWQGIDCGKKAPLYSKNNEENTLAVENVKSTFSIFPNPTSNSITISSERDFNAIEIIDLFGRIIHSQINHANSITLDVSKYSAGIYFAHIISKNGVSVKKFVKK